MFDRFLNVTLTNGFIPGPYKNIWVGKTEFFDVSSWHHIPVVHVAPLKSVKHVKHVPNQSTYAV